MLVDQNSLHFEPVTLNKWTPVVEGIRQRNQESMSELYAAFHRGVRFFILRQLGAADLEDGVQDCMVAVIAAIQGEGLADYERLPGLVAIIMRRYIAARISDRVRARASETDIENIDKQIPGSSLSPEKIAAQGEILRIARTVLKTMEPVGREVLMRFYVGEQGREQVCSEMGLSETRFKNLKHRAKELFAEQCRTEMGLHRKPADSEQPKAISMVA